MTDVIRAHADRSLSARIVEATPLTYDDDPKDDVDDRPDHVRAGSSLAYVFDELAVVQDDANFLALVDRDTHSARSIPLPKGPEGARVHSDEYGNQDRKFDLEACVVVPGTEGDLLIALGSGSGPQREWIVIVDWRDRAAPHAQKYRAREFYQMLREEHAFSGSGLNVEGLIFVDNDRMRLFQRGNADPTDDLDSVDATADMSYREFTAYLDAPDSNPVPELQNIIQYELGELEGIRLTFSDAAMLGEDVLFSASAEASAESDYVAGSVLGVIDGPDVRWTTVLDQNGEIFTGKIEGLSVPPHEPHRAYFVIDADDAGKPSNIYEVELSGPWYPKQTSDTPTTE